MFDNNHHCLDELSKWILSLLSHVTISQKRVPPIKKTNCTLPPTNMAVESKTPPKPPHLGHSERTGRFPSFQVPGTSSCPSPSPGSDLPSLRIELRSTGPMWNPVTWRSKTIFGSNTFKIFQVFKRMDSKWQVRE